MMPRQRDENLVAEASRLYHEENLSVAEVAARVRRDERTVRRWLGDSLRRPGRNAPRVLTLSHRQSALLAALGGQAEALTAASIMASELTMEIFRFRVAFRLADVAPATLRAVPAVLGYERPGWHAWDEQVSRAEPGTPVDHACDEDLLPLAPGRQRMWAALEPRSLLGDRRPPQQRLASLTESLTPHLPWLWTAPLPLDLDAATRAQVWRPGTELSFVVLRELNEGGLRVTRGLGGHETHIGVAGSLAEARELGLQAVTAARADAATWLRDAAGGVTDWLEMTTDRLPEPAILVCQPGQSGWDAAKAAGIRVGMISGQTLPASSGDPVGIAEIASRLHADIQAVQAWFGEGLLPPPQPGTISGQPWWQWADIAAAAEQLGLAGRASAPPVPAGQDHDV